MLISLNWIRDFVDLPEDVDVRALAEKFTRTTAEVETVERLEVGAKNLIAARVVSVKDIPGTPNMRLAELDLGDRTIQTVTIAPVLPIGWNVVYAPPGARVNAALSSESTALTRSDGASVPNIASASLAPTPCTVISRPNQSCSASSAKP